MSSFYFTAYFVLVFVFCEAASYYRCENGVYDTLYHLTEECRQASYIPYLRSLRKREKHVSGQDIAQMLEEYCSSANDATLCVEDYVSKLPCLRQELEPFRLMNRRSNWYCHEDKARDVIKDIYNSLPTENLSYRTNQCYKEAPTTAYPCIKRYLNVSKPPKDKRETMKKILSSFRCTYRKLLRKCSRSTALLLTTLEYDWLIIPPALGINVSDTMLTVARIKV